MFDFCLCVCLRRRGLRPHLCGAQRSHFGKFRVKSLASRSSAATRPTRTRPRATSSKTWVSRGSKATTTSQTVSTGFAEVCKSNFRYSVCDTQTHSRGTDLAIIADEAAVREPSRAGPLGSRSNSSLSGRGWIPCLPEVLVPSPQGPPSFAG